MSRDSETRRGRADGSRLGSGADESDAAREEAGGRRGGSDAARSETRAAHGNGGDGRGRVAEAERARDAARRGERRAAFLAEASRLLAASLEYEATLGTVAALALPDLGAWCIVDVIEDGEAMRRLAIVHPDPAKRPLLERLQATWPPLRDDPLGLPVVMRTGEPQIVRAIDDETLGRYAHDEANVALLRELGLGSFLTVPLAARGRVLGAITFVAGGEREYGDDELLLARDLALRAALAIDNARLYREVDRARRDAQVASRAKGQFLAVMSHELRTPINAIVGYAELVDMGVGGPVSDKQHDMLARIQTSTRHLTTLIDQVLDVARTEAGRIPLAQETGSVPEAVASARALVEPEIARAGLTIIDRCDEAPDTLFVGDATRVRQILINLLSNATKFTSRGGTITCTCDTDDRGPPELRGRSGPWARIDIVDTGIGIASELLETIFQPFEQGEPGLTRTRGGAGLGLAISRQLGRLMGGELTVRSRPGAGSRFTLWLPAPAGDDTAADRRAAEAAGAPSASSADLGRQLLARIRPVLRAYTQQLRTLPIFADHAGTSELLLRDHATILVAATAQALLAAAETGRAVDELAAEGATIVRTIASMHGTQRARLDWTEAQLRADIAALRESLEAELRRHPAAGEVHDLALDIVHHLFGLVERAAASGWTAAKAAH